MKIVKTLILFAITIVCICCPEIAKEKEILGDNVLTVTENIISIRHGETGTIHVNALNAEGKPDIIYTVCSNSCINTTVNADQTISVEGVDIGEAILTVTGNSGLEKDVIVRIYDPKTMMTDGLIITYTDQFECRWDDSGSGYDHDCAFFHPIPPAGVHPLGSVDQTYDATVRTRHC
jgi:hypothetical protein